MRRQAKRARPTTRTTKKKPNKLNSDIIHLSDAIRRKYLAIKVGRDGQKKELEHFHKPIIKPLDALIEVVKKSPVIKSEVPLKATEYFSPPLSQKHNDDKSANETDLEQSSSEDDTSTNEYLELSMQEQDKSLNEYLEQYHELPRMYIRDLLTEKNFHDSSFGIVHDPSNESWTVGNSTVIFDNNGDITIETTKKKYKATPGLYELIFKKAPINYDEDDVNNYLEIVSDTNAHRRNNDPNERIKASRSFKYRNIIKRLVNREEVEESTPPTSHKRTTKSILENLTSRIGFGHSDSSLSLIAGDTRPYQYVYFDDINEIVDRLRLLVSSQQAGNTSHNNEIVSIIEELREANVIF